MEGGGRRVGEIDHHIGVVEQLRAGSSPTVMPKGSVPARAPRSMPSAGDPAPFSAAHDQDARRLRQHFQEHLPHPAGTAGDADAGRPIQLALGLGPGS